MNAKDNKFNENFTDIQAILDNNYYIHHLCDLNSMLQSEEQVTNKFLETIQRSKRALLAKKVCDGVYHNEYAVLEPMEFQRLTLFSYYMDIYEIPSIKELDSYEEIPHLKTFCGQSFMNKF